MNRSIMTIAALMLTTGLTAPAIAAEPPAPAKAAECKEGEKPGQQKVVEGKSELSPGSAAEASPPVDKTAALATKPDEAKTPTEVTKDIAANPKTTENGSKVAATGEAKPKENWFGCPPTKKE
ncbi:MAG: hypothetical protein VX871_02710 [Pseudomonadota bacterium]|nr:hypothetical protein [Pseudomonadota bacterium]